MSIAIISILWALEENGLFPIWAAIVLSLIVAMRFTVKTLHYMEKLDRFRDDWDGED